MNYLYRQREIPSSMEVPSMEYQVLHVPPRTGSRIYFNKPDFVVGEELQYMAFHSPDALDAAILQAEIPALPAQWLRSGESERFDRPWYPSTCSMVGVTSITTSVEQSSDPRAICGMLLRYANGDTRCLGNFRFALVKETIEIPSGAEKLYICHRSSWTIDIPWSTIVGISITRPLDLSGPNWRRRPARDMDEARDSFYWEECRFGRGRLEFWNSSSEGIVRYKGDE